MRVLICLGLCMIGFLSAGCDDSGETATAPPAVQASPTLAQLKESVVAKGEELTGEYTEEDYKVFDEFQTNAFRNALTIAIENPSSDKGLEATEWLLVTPRAWFVGPGIPAFDLATEQYSERAEMAKVVAMLGKYCTYQPPNYTDLKNAAWRLVDKVSETNTNDLVQAEVSLAYALRDYSDFEIAENAKAENVDELAAKSIERFEKVQAEFGSVKRAFDNSKETIGAACRSALNRLKSLRIGQVVPDIDGEDLDGVAFKLSDYRGKVVLVSFWGHW